MSGQYEWHEIGWFLEEPVPSNYEEVIKNILHLKSENNSLKELVKRLESRIEKLEDEIGAMSEP